MLKKWVSPIANLMHRLSFKHKFIFVGTTMAFATLVALAPSFLQMLKDYQGIIDRQQGTMLISETLGIMAQVSEHRHISLMALRGVGNLDENQRSALSAAIDTALANLGKHPELNAASTQTRLNTVSLWIALKNKSSTRHNPNQVNADYVDLLFALREQITALSIASGIARDTDATMVFLAELLGHDLPRLLIHFSDASSYGILSVVGHLNDEDRQKLGYVSQHLSVMVDDIVAAPPHPIFPEATLALLPTVSAFANFLLNRGVLSPELGIKTGELMQLRLSANQALGGLTQATVDTLNIRLSQRYREMKLFFDIQLLAITIILIVAVYVFYGFWHASTETIDNIVTTTEHVMAGNLNAKTDVRSRDELFKIAERFNELVDTLRTTLGHIAGHSEDVGNMAGRLHCSAAMVIQNTEVQAKSAASTSVSMQQIAAGLASVKETAVDLEQFAEHGLTQIQGGETALGHLEHRMNDAQAIMNRIAEVSQQFVSDAHHVAQMTQRVKEISDQTNLLALNAAIEAARAGTAGRGFAVVADEVRKLAENVASTVREIDKVMQVMMQKSQDVTRTIETGTINFREAANGLFIVTQSLDCTANAVRKTHQGVFEINRTIAEQKVASEDIVQHVDAIAHMAEQTHHAVGDVYDLIRDLSELTSRMNNQVAHFQS